MIESQSVLAIITARGGSKRLVGKNIIPLAGKPLIAWTVEASQSSQYIDRTILSSDDKNIIKVAREYGCDVPFVRSKELSMDETNSVDVVIDALSKVPHYDWFVLLQPTSPLRLGEDIDGCLRNVMLSGYNCAVSICETSKSPYWAFMKNEQGQLEKLIPDVYPETIRQKLPQTYTLNGAIYAARTDWFMQNRCFITDETYGYEMPKERSEDIDDYFDVQVAELRLKLKSMNEGS
jgi:N-acylneuraminate cytidylyltransferase